MATGGTSIKKTSRARWLIAAGVVLAALAGAAVIVLVVVYPRVGATKVRDKLIGKAQQLGLTATIGDVDVRIGHATLTNIDVRSPRDGDMPLVHVDKIAIDFDGGASLLGNVELGEVAVEGVIVNVRRTPDGLDNVRDAVDKYRALPHSTDPGDGKSKLPTSIKVTGVHLLANDMLTGATAQIGDGNATWTPGQLVAELRTLTATTLSAPKASAKSVKISKASGKPPTVAIDGGEVAIWPKLALSGIAGTISPEDATHYKLDLAGGYGGVPGQLWTAKGGLDATGATASIDLEAAKFQLEKLAPVLERSGVVDYAQTSIDTNIHLDLDRNGAKFAGELHVRGLNVGHPMIADREVHDLDLTAKIAGSFDRAARRIDLTTGDFVARDLPFSLTGAIAAPPREPDAPLEVVGKDGNKVRVVGPHGIKELHLRLVIPPIDCQKALVAIPTDMAPYMAGYRLRGVFDTDVHLDVDWADLDKTELDGHVGLKHCRVVSEPSDSPKRLKEEFEHYVEVEKGEWESFVVGPTNPDFVPLDDISPYLIKSIMSTEDSAFYQHHGFIPSEFKSALVTDLKAGEFRYGASSITMQMVKNVLLYREKTLARKMQELFLTWHVENTLTKDRIMEIYLNVIEYGPNLYGIGPAAQRYFGKPAKDLNPVEAAFFSTILPNPKARYEQYCDGTLTKWTADKINRILKIMLARERLTQEEYDKALATPLLFQKDDAETEKECKDRVKKAIKNARSTSAPKKP